VFKTNPEARKAGCDTNSSELCRSVASVGLSAEDSGTSEWELQPLRASMFTCGEVQLASRSTVAEPGVVAALLAVSVDNSSSDSDEDSELSTIGLRLTPRFCAAGAGLAFLGLPRGLGSLVVAVGSSLSSVSRAFSFLGLPRGLGSLVVAAVSAFLGLPRGLGSLVVAVVSSLSWASRAFSSSQDLRSVSLA
jgi:hypothetical protein